MQNILKKVKSGVQGGTTLHRDNFVGCSAYPFCGQLNIHVAIEHLIFEPRIGVGVGGPWTPSAIRISLQ